MPRTPHDEIVSSLLDVLNPLNGEIRLLGRVSDSVIGNPSEREVFFLIPDLHVLSPHRRQRFKYGFNHSESGLLAKLLERIATLRNAWEATRQTKLVTVQLGDFFDLWREFPKSVKPAEITDDTHRDLRDILYRGIDRGGPCLKATMLLGNHDTKRSDPLQEIRFRYKFFNRPQDGKPFLFGTHGDAFNIIETTVPSAIKEFAVYFIGTFVEPNNHPVMEWSKMTAKINKPMRDLKTAITEPEHTLEAPAGAMQVTPEKELPPLVCQEIRSPGDTANSYFQKLYQALDIARDMDLPGQHVKVVVMGHTHKASLILCRPNNGDRPMLLMDVGAWIEHCTYPLAENGALVTEPSAQLGVIHSNDARIYQIRLLQRG